MSDKVEIGNITNEYGVYCCPPNKGILAIAARTNIGTEIEGKMAIWAKFPDGREVILPRWCSDTLIFKNENSVQKLYKDTPRFNELLTECLFLFREAYPEFEQG